MNPKTLPITLNESIEIDADRCGGKPVLNGTRVPAAQVLAELADGNSAAGLSEDYDIPPGEIETFLKDLAKSLDCPQTASVVLPLGTARALYSRAAYLSDSGPVIDQGWQSEEFANALDALKKAIDGGK